MQFSDWFTGTDLLGSRAERFYEDMESYRGDEIRCQVAMIKWLDSAYEAGKEDALRSKKDNPDL